MLKYSIALIALSFSIQTLALDAKSFNEQPKNSLTMVQSDPSVPPTRSDGGGGGGLGNEGPGRGFIKPPKLPPETLPPVIVIESPKPGELPVTKTPELPRPVVEQPIAKEPETPRPVVDLPTTKVPEIPVYRRLPIVTKTQKSCGFIKSQLNSRIIAVPAIGPLMAQRNSDFDMLKDAQNRIYDLSMQVSPTKEESLKASLLNEISCFKDVALAAQANFDANSQAISKLLNSPIDESVRPPIRVENQAQSPSNSVYRYPASSGGGGSADKPPGGGVHANK
jgi:hypothetical protein